MRKSNDGAWERTQRTAGYLPFGVGVIGVVAACIQVDAATPVIPLLAVGAGVYSGYAWRQETAR